MSFPSNFISSLVVVHRSRAKSHGLFFLVFIHRILLDLGLEDFPASEPIHIIAPIGATFLKQRAGQLKASSKHPRVESSIANASRPPTFSDPIAEEYVDPTAVVNPPPSSSSNSSLQSMLDTIMTIQVVQEQILLDVLTKLQALQADLEGARCSTPPPPPFNDES